MQTVSELYKAIVARPDHQFEYGAYINGVWYGQDKIVSLRTYGSIYNGDGPSIGGTVCREIDITLYDYGDIATNAKIEPKVRAFCLDGQVIVHSEWLDKGVFYIDTRDPDDESRTITMHGFDIMLSLDNIAGNLLLDWSSGITPKGYVIELLDDPLLGGCALDKRSNLIDYLPLTEPPARATARDVLGWIAALHGGNFIITDKGDLLLIRLPIDYTQHILGEENGIAISVGGVLIGVQDEYDRTPGVFNIGLKEEKSGTIPAYSPISKLILHGQSEDYEAGDDSGYKIEAECGFAVNETWAVYILEIMKLRGYVYRPVTADNALIDPAAELGDVVEIDSVYTQIAIFDTTFNALMLADVGSPGGRESEYPRFKNAGGDVEEAKDYTDQRIAEAASDSLQVRIVSALPKDHAKHNILWVIPTGAAPQPDDDDDDDDEAEAATLSKITLFPDSLVLNPSFSAETTSYTITATNNMAVITATAASSSDVVNIVSNKGGSAWDNGEAQLSIPSLSNATVIMIYVTRPKAEGDSQSEDDDKKVVYKTYTITVKGGSA